MGRPTGIAFVVALTGVAHADITVDPCACSPNKPGFHRASTLTGDWGGLRADLFEAGVKVQATYAGEVFAAPGLESDRVVNAGLGALALDLDFATLTKIDHLGSLHLAGFWIHGDGLDTRLMDTYGVSNNVAPPGVRLFEAWYEQPIGPFSIRAGLIAADQEFVLAEHSTVLLDATFGILAMLSVNIGNPVYPVAAPGASLHYDSELVKLRAAFYANQVESHGIPSDVGGDGLFINEVELIDTFKLGFWHHTVNGDGYYAIADKQLERYVGTFARVSYAPDSPMSIYADTGLRIGPGPLRKRDFASVGLAFARTQNFGAQTIVEATYQYLVKGWLTVQPDAQLLLTRNGTAGVFALRAVVAL